MLCSISLKCLLFPWYPYPAYTNGHPLLLISVLCSSPPECVLVLPSAVCSTSEDWPGPGNGFISIKNDSPRSGRGGLKQIERHSPPPRLLAPVLITAALHVWLALMNVTRTSAALLLISWTLWTRAANDPLRSLKIQNHRKGRRRHDAKHKIGSLAQRSKWTEEGMVSIDS